MSIQVHCLKLCPLEEFIFALLQDVPEWDCGAAPANFRMVPVYYAENSPWGLLCRLGGKKQYGARARTIGIWSTSSSKLLVPSGPFFLPSLPAPILYIPLPFDDRILLSCQLYSLVGHPVYDGQRRLPGNMMACV